MKSSYVEREILLNEEISPGIFKLVVKVKETIKPGQFYMLRGWSLNDPFLSRPLSVYDYEEGKLSFLYAKVGKGTSILSELNVGEKINLLGPLGNGFEDVKGDKIALVSGGIGIAPLLYLAKTLNVKIDVYSGFRKDIYSLEEFNKYVDKIHYSTENGSKGYKGFITDLLEPEEYDLIIACGPTPMLKVLKEKCNEKTPLLLSLESRMACGIGACIGCTVETTKGMKRVCKEGPVFLAEEVIFND